MCAFSLHRRTRSVRIRMEDMEPKKQDRTPGPATPVVTSLSTGIDLPPKQVEPADDPHQEAPGQHAQGEEGRAGNDPRFVKEIFPLVHGQVFTGMASTGPPPNWNKAREIWSLPLRGYRPNTLPEGLEPHCPTYITSPSPRPSNLHPKHHDSADLSNMQHNISNNAEFHAGSEQSAEHVFTAHGLERELRKIWPESLPSDIKELAHGLAEAIKTGKVTLGSPHSSEDLQDNERTADGRHHRVHTLGSFAQLRKSSPLKNLRGHYKNGEANEIGNGTLPYSQPGLYQQAPEPALPGPSGAPMPEAYVFATPIATAATFTDVPASLAPQHATAAATEDKGKRAQRDNKSIRYLEGLSDHLKHHDDARQDHDRVLGEMARANASLRATNEAYQKHIIEKDGQLAYQTGVIHNIVDENHQLKMQLQARGYGWTVQGSPNGALHGQFESVNRG